MGGGGGHGSGKVSYSPYLEASHSHYLGVNTTYPLTTNMSQAINIALAASPYTSALAFDPTANIVAMFSAIDAFDAVVNGYLTPTAISDEVAAYAAILDADINTNIIPAYNARARDAGLVMSSAFAIGAALITASRTREVSKFTTGLRIRNQELTINGKREVMHYNVEANRMAIASQHDESQINNEYDVKDAEWEIDCILKGGQLIAAIGGGTFVPDKPGKMQSGIMGALSGGAMGAMVAGASGGAIAGPVGIAAGAALGLASSFM